MGIAILTNEIGLSKPSGSKLELVHRKKEFSMKLRRPSCYDHVSAKQRISTPFSYRWLKIKIRLFGLPTRGV
jgi:hypothetical protein